jgi:hypothetical protein
MKWLLQSATAAAASDYRRDGSRAAILPAERANKPTACMASSFERQVRFRAIVDPSLSSCEGH